MQPAIVWDGLGGLDRSSGHWKCRFYTKLACGLIMVALAGLYMSATANEPDLKLWEPMLEPVRMLT